MIICLTGIKRAVFRVFCPWLAGEVGFRGSLASFMAAVAFPVLELLLRARRYCCSGLALSKQSSASTAAQSSTQSRIFSVVAGWCWVWGAGAQMVTTSRRGNFICTTEGTRNQCLVILLLLLCRLVACFSSSFFTMYPPQSVGEPGRGPNVRSCWSSEAVWDAVDLRRLQLFHC